MSAEVRAIVRWSTDDGSTHEWPMATVDNQRSRVIARMARYGMDTPDALATLTIERVK